MPDAKNNAKLTGDTHPPEVEDATHALSGDADLPAGAGADSAPRDAAQARGEDAGKPGRDENAAGFVKNSNLSGNQGGPNR